MLWVVRCDVMTAGLSCAECLVSLGIADDWYRDHQP